MKVAHVVPRTWHLASQLDAEIVWLSVTYLLAAGGAFCSQMISWSPSFSLTDEILGISSLARTLRSVLCRFVCGFCLVFNMVVASPLSLSLSLSPSSCCSLQRGNPHVHVQINEWSEVDRLMEVGANHVKPRVNSQRVFHAQMGSRLVQIQHRSHLVGQFSSGELTGHH